MKVYTKIEAKPELEKLSGWKFENSGIEKKFVFNDFKESLVFINKVGALAEEHNHHPELFNVYNKVNIRLSTHDYNGVTNKDFNLAKAIDLL
ncbi:4a-hydroxytetrahydrobiopterin dehydratase [Flavobacterium sp.]|uniref:4a-hydroxytetrahydrobiopterin dehydratase n=1 Tax=Flavobacterium sp. TaxID=239 RepID=UPI003750B3B8